VGAHRERVETEVDSLESVFSRGQLAAAPKRGLQRPHGTQHSAQIGQQRSQCSTATSFGLGRFLPPMRDRGASGLSLGVLSGSLPVLGRGLPHATLPREIRVEQRESPKARVRTAEILLAKARKSQSAGKKSRSAR